jgi:hypothetical protein
MSFDDPKWRRDWLRRLQRRANIRADRAGIEFDLKNPEHAATLYDRQNGRCAVSRVEFNLQRFDDALVKHPFAPSIDRILSSRGYTEDNVRLVCVAVNFGMGEWGQEVYMTLARAAVAHEAGEQRKPDPSGDSNWHARQREKIAAAEVLWKSAVEPERSKLAGRLRALRRNLKLGPDGLRRAARRAHKTRHQRVGKL